MDLSRLRRHERSDRIAEGRDLLRFGLWVAGAVLLGTAVVLDPGRVCGALRSTAPQFAILAAILVSGMAAERAGLFRMLAGLLLPTGAGPRTAVAAILVVIALVSGLVNLDVAVVVGVPLALSVAAGHRRKAGDLVLAVALTANSTSFLLPTSNVTSLLILSHVDLPVAAFLRESVLPWLLVTGFTVGILAFTVRNASSKATIAARAGVAPGLPGLLLDLIPMLAAAAGLRALLVGGIAVTGGFVRQVTVGALLAAGINNLAAAAAWVPAGQGPWPGILAMALGPNLLVTGSIASLIARQVAGASGRFSVVRYSLVGALLLPAQLVLACAGLMPTMTGTCL